MLLDNLDLYIRVFPLFGYSIGVVSGLVFGSFLTFVIPRILNGEPWIWGADAKRSRCGRCRHILGIFDLVPVFSWMWQRGRCRYCHARVPIIYPATEIICAGVGVGVMHYAFYL